MSNSLKFFIFLACLSATLLGFHMRGVERDDFFRDLKKIPSVNPEYLAVSLRGTTYRIPKIAQADIVGCFAQIEPKLVRVSGERGEISMRWDSDAYFSAEFQVDHRNQIVVFGGLPIDCGWPSQDVFYGRTFFFGVSSCLYFQFFKMGILTQH
ncbi:hypothetical protein [Microbulbifer elongatus]|uniref:hypothetical protein n=1 Tax=Microbulbifer elongatus TaxID=86173 RepID=UPI001CFF505B|nr:hypothetical protein [Microbulbifer elongatus]